MIGFDYTARIDPASLKASGCQVAFRYFTRPDWPKSITSGEVAELAAAGIAIVVNFETTADRMRSGAAGGHADATELLGYMAAHGAPADSVAGYYSADWDVQPTEVILALDYLDAAAAVHGSKSLVGCYGGYRMVGAAADAGYRIWQTVAWSGGRWDPRAVARQTGEQRTVGGVSVDVNDITNPSALGAWTTTGGTMGDIALSGGYANEWPDLAGFLAPKFPPGQQASIEVDAEWANFGSRAAAEYARQARNELNVVKSELDQVNGKLDQVLAAMAVLKTGGIDTAALAADVTHDMGTKLSS